MEAQPAKREKKQKKQPKRWRWCVTIVLVTVCISAAFSFISSVLLENSGMLAAFLLRLLGGAPYQTVRLWYEEEMNKSVIAGTIVEEGEKTLQNFSAQVGETIENLGKKVLV